MSGAAGPAYRIETGRLVLRCWQPADAPLVHRAIAESVDHLRPWMPWARGELEDLEATVARLRRFRGDFDLGRDFVYGIFDPGGTRVLGGSGLHTRAGAGALEIGYWIHVSHVRQGYATEAAAALTRVAFEIDGVTRVEIRCDAANRPSAAIPRRLGFQLERVVEQDVTRGGAAKRDATREDGPMREGDPPPDTMVWILSADTYPRSPARVAGARAFDVLGRELLLAAPSPTPAPTP